jgi:hypothetical protein
MPILTDTQAAPRAPHQSAKVVIEERRYIQRFNRSQVRFLVVRVCRNAAGEVVTRVSIEPYLGL